MSDPATTRPIDYLVIGHVAKDITQDGYRLGGTAAYAGLTAHALGLRVGVVTSHGADLDLGPLQDLAVFSLPAGRSTTFENRYTSAGRKQWLLGNALPLGPAAVPLQWRSVPVVHLGPIADEVDPRLADHFPGALMGLTPQGWLRECEAGGHIRPKSWNTISQLLPKASAVVLSEEDLGEDPDAISSVAELCQLLVVTEGYAGAWVHWRQERRHFAAPTIPEVDPTGAGDVFAAAFFVHLSQGYDPWAAAQFATHLASASIARAGLEGVPTPEEIRSARVQELS